MFPLFDTIGGKTPGELIRSNDWNTLVQAVDGLNQTVTDGFSTVNNRLDDLTARVETVETTLTAFQSRIDSLLSQYYRISLQTTQSTYALGDRAELLATVTDVFGDPVQFTNATRPWIDFVSTWGQFRVVGGFETRGGVGQRSASVRVNTQGIARVELRADHIDDGDEDDDDEVFATLNTIVANNQTVSQLITQSASPVGAQAAYSVMTAQYNASPGYRQYVDKSYNHNHWSKAVGSVDRIVAGNWDEYRSTVLAFVKNDSDAQTPDPGRGFASTQITFRDWVRGWSVLDYLDFDDNDPEILDLGNRFDDLVAQPGLFDFDRVKDIVREKVRPDGYFSRARDYQVVDKAFERVNPRENARVIETIRGGLVLEQNAVLSQGGLTGTRAQGSFASLTNGVALSSQAVGALSDEVGGIQRNLAQTGEAVSQIGGRVQVQTGQLDALFSESGAINILQRDVDTVKGSVSRFLDFNPSEVLEKAELLRDTNVQLMERVFEVINRRDG